tara:strand:+ start:382 stop:585 length:204 start_codon:yes stop_codon:yes gene_type:complete
MSTTFGVKIEGELIPIARRVGIGEGKVHVYSINPIAYFLDEDIEVIAMDNSQQGVHTIKDIKKLMIQ